MHNWFFGFFKNCEDARQGLTFMVTSENVRDTQRLLHFQARDAMDGSESHRRVHGWRVCDGAVR